MIRVILDGEMIKDFFEKPNLVVFSPRKGDTVSLDGEAWVYGASEHKVFRLGPKSAFQYDREFTEWLKENRPEVFL